MTYLGNLSTSQRLYIENRDNQTIVTLISSSNTQQQSQSSSLETGNWTIPPSLFKTENTFLLRIESVKGQYFIQVQSNGLNILKTSPSLNNVDVLPLEMVSQTETSNQSSVQFSPMKPMQPMQPMQPMKLNDMSMDINAMEMRMGDMYLRMPENPSTESSSQSHRRFCTKCGNLVKIEDCFCAYCGHKLED